MQRARTARREIDFLIVPRFDIQNATTLTIELDSPPARLEQRLLERRAELAAPSEPLTVATPWTSMPRLGHDPRRVARSCGLGPGTSRSAWTASSIAVPRLPAR